MQGTQYATKRSILYRGAFCGPTQHLAASDLVLHCLSMSHKKDARLIRVNTYKVA